MKTDFKSLFFDEDPNDVYNLGLPKAFKTSVQSDTFDVHALVKQILGKMLSGFQDLYSVDKDEDTTSLTGALIQFRKLIPQPKYHEKGADGQLIEKHVAQVPGLPNGGK